MTRDQENCCNKDIWLTCQETISDNAESDLDDKYKHEDIGFFDLDMCTDNDKSRHKATLDGRFTSEQLRDIADAMDNLSNGVPRET